MKFALVFYFLVWILSQNACAQQALILARAPQLSPDIISKTWTPFVDYLKKETGRQISLKVYLKREEFERDILNGDVDLYFGNPAYGIIGHLNHGYMPLIRSDRKLLEGIIVVRKDSGIHSIKDLENKKIAFPSPNAFAASKYIRSLFDSGELSSYSTVFTGSHDNTYRAVLVGEVAAGSGVTRTLELEDATLKEKLKIIYTTPGLKSHPLMAHPRVSAMEQKAIQTAILALNLSDAGKKMLESIKLQRPVIADYTTDYKSVENLSIKMYHHMLK